MCVLAGDISPIDVISHIPGLCEELSIPYCYVSSKADLGAAAGTKRPTSVVLVAPKKGSEFDAADKLKECVDEIKELAK
jgi:H/ACA ribonucleoprotein complex subunit 2